MRAMSGFERELGRQYHEAATAALARFAGDVPEIRSAADLSYSALRAGGVLHAFGSGHSSAGAIELFHRAGGLVPVNGILEPFLSPFLAPSKSGKLERILGIGALLAETWDIRAGEVLFVFSNSGVNPVPIEIAETAIARGAKVVAITSREHAAATASRHPSGKKLIDVADVVIDNGARAGDAAIEYAPGHFAAAISGVVNAYVVNRLVAEICARYIADGAEPPIYLSANLPGGDAHNAALEKKYRDRLKGLWR